MRKIAIFTGNRAEYGLQYPVITSVSEHPELTYYLLVSGAHLQEDFGYTKTEIEKDGFQVFSEVQLLMEEDSLYATAQAIGSGILSLSRILKDIQPDFLVVYADRFEGFSALITGTQMNIPTAHIEGGDLTEGGALDDSVRHAMTKLAHLHFTTNKQAAERILKLGEEPWRIHNVGLPALDLVVSGKLASTTELRELYSLDPLRPTILFTQHSVTTEYQKAAAQVRPAIGALLQLAQGESQVVITYPNNDAGGKRIIKEIEKLRGTKNIQIHKSLGRYNYHGILKMCGDNGVCVGNSSSGIKETAIFGCPVVNIGSRQKGRLRAENVLDVDYKEEDIYSACQKAIDDKVFREVCHKTGNPYGVGNAGPKIAEVLSNIDIDSKLLQKKMTF